MNDKSSDTTPPVEKNVLIPPTSRWWLLVPALLLCLGLCWVNVLVTGTFPFIVKPSPVTFERLVRDITIINQTDALLVIEDVEGDYAFRHHVFPLTTARINKDFYRDHGITRETPIGIRVWNYDDGTLLYTCRMTWQDLIDRPPRLTISTGSTRC